MSRTLFDVGFAKSAKETDDSTESDQKMEDAAFSPEGLNSVLFIAEMVIVRLCYCSEIC